ncbi:hypothetical protein JOF56_001873 [Kibdelosporangium banguiense]|uniref:DUF4097 domain-containing protein n=1 Tax=Kibdelosporangium banguiense TaxID=1365924 RepID=A0ABS4TCA1_9PSEU|nr:DUF4097 family beta strand repeat-containing protein [Kibdelosporangium banguiense]MBP2321488.1 hypothetical protein [Kibdelosporangium banguiense]
MRTFTHHRSGATLFGLSVGAAVVDVVGEEREHAEVVLAPAVAGDHVAEDLIARATETNAGERFTIEVPKACGITGTTIVHNGGLTVSQGVSVMFGSVSGVTIVNGQIIGGLGSAVVTGGGALRVTVRLPLGSSLAVSTDCADVHARGQLNSVYFRAVSGDLTVESARVLDAESTSGDISLDCGTHVTAKTVSGDVRVSGLAGRAQVTSVSGDVRVHAVTNSIAAGQTVSGDVRFTATPGVMLDSVGRSVSGRVTGATR